MISRGVAPDVAKTFLSWYERNGIILKTDSTNIDFMVNSLLRSTNQDIKQISKEGKFPIEVRKKDKTIGIPTITPESSNDPMLVNMTALAISKGYRLDIIPVDYKPLPNTHTDFWNGFFYELRSRDAIAAIKFSKTSSFSNGRCCARYEILKTCTSPESQAFITNVSKEIVGHYDEKKQALPLLEVVIAATFIEAHREDAMRVFKTLVQFEDEHELRKRFTNAKAFFVSYGDLSRRAKRVVKIEKKGKKKKAETILKTVTPTKPSQLATVAPAERSIVSELYETPWDNFAQMEEAFKKRNPFEIKFPELLKKLREVNNLMWSQKQKVLRATRHRIDLVPSNKNETELTKKLTGVRVYLSGLTDYSSLIVWYNTVEKGCSIIDNFGKIKVKEETFFSLISLLKTKHGNRYPTAQKVYNNLSELGLYGEKGIGSKAALDTQKSRQTQHEEENVYDSDELSEQDEPVDDADNPANAPD